MNERDVRSAWWLYALFVGILVLYWTIYALAPNLYRQLLYEEDGLVEWATFFGFAAACGLCVLVLKRDRRKMSRWGRLYFGGLALFFFLCAGEEISWGQRMIGLETPPAIAALNEQGEINLHNLRIEHFHPSSVVEWIFRAMGIVVPLILIRRSLRRNDEVARYVFSPLLIPCFAMADVVGALEEWVPKHLGHLLSKDCLFMISHETDEIMEMYWGLSSAIALVFVLRAWKRWNASRSAPAPGAGDSSCCAGDR